MQAHAQTPDLSLPPLPDLGAGLDMPAMPMAADSVPVTVPAATATAASTPTTTTTPAAPTTGSRASADSIDDLLPSPTTKPASETAVNMSGETPLTAPALTSDLPSLIPETTPATTPVVADAPPVTTGADPLPPIALVEDPPLPPLSLADEAAAKGIKPPDLGLPPTSEATAQALLSGQPLGSYDEEEPEQDILVKVQRKPTVRDLPRLRPVIHHVHNKNYNYQRQILPPSIYKQAYSGHNRHLPKAMSVQEYDRHLFGAVAANNVNGTRAFLERGKSVNMMNGNGETLLMTAVRYGALDTMRLLLARGADPRLGGINGMTPLQLAESSGQRTMAEVLRARGA